MERALQRACTAASLPNLVFASWPLQENEALPASRRQAGGNY